MRQNFAPSNMYSAMLLAAAERAMPRMWEDVAQGRRRALRGGEGDHGV